MNDEREWVPVEVLWDNGRGAEVAREPSDWLFADQDELADLLNGVFPSSPEELYMTKRKRKKLRGEER